MDKLIVLYETACQWKSTCAVITNLPQTDCLIPLAIDHFHKSLDKKCFGDALCWGERDVDILNQKKKLPLCLSANEMLLKEIKMSNDLNIFGKVIMCLIKQILTRLKAFCRSNPLKAIFMSMHGPVLFVYMYGIENECRCILDR